MSLLSKCMKLDENIRKPLDVGLIWEGNYWDDQDVHDCCDVDWETCDHLVRKIAKALTQHHFPIDPSHENPSNSRPKVVIYLPKVLQLPLTLLAASRAGLVAILLDPLSTEIDHLEAVVLEEKPKIVVTVDAFWQGHKLIEVKRSIENLRGMDCTQLLVIRHVAPNDGIPAPKRDIPARRPSYKTLFDLRNGRDLEWSEVMAAVETEEEKAFEWTDHDTVVVVYDANRTKQPVSLSQLLAALEIRKLGLEAKMEKEGVSSVENVMCLDAPKAFGSLVDFLIPWFMGKTMTLYEGPLDYPDSSRLAQIISKHSVNVLLGSSSSSNYSIPNPEYLKFFATPSLRLLDVPHLAKDNFSSM